MWRCGGWWSGFVSGTTLLFGLNTRHQVLFEVVTTKSKWTGGWQWYAYKEGKLAGLGSGPGTELDAYRDALKAISDGLHCCED
jgi:hypothetical protein